MRIICIADTHGRHGMLTVPVGDVLIHAGDLTESGTLAEIRGAFEWLASLPHRHKVVIAGNHDFSLERTPAEARALVPAGVTYLEGGTAEVEGMLVWGGPWSPLFAGWAFEANPLDIRGHWEAIPDDVDVLVTHTPAAGTLDDGIYAKHAGCEILRSRISALGRLRLHVHGHIHEARGQAYTRQGQTRVVNASCFPGAYAHDLHSPLTVEL